MPRARALLVYDPAVPTSRVGASRGPKRSSADTPSSCCGEKLRGGIALQRTRPGAKAQWLLIKRRDEYARPEFEHATIIDRVTSGIERRAREGRWPNGRIPSKPSLTNSAASSTWATPTRQRRCYESSSPTCASTAGRKSCPSTASAHPWFAHRQVQWS